MFNSVEEIVEFVRPLIQEEIAKAALAERAHFARELLRVLDHGASREQIRSWCEANIEVVEMTTEQP